MANDKEDFLIDERLVQPLFVAVSDRLRALIEDGTFPPGSRFPSEIELAHMLGISRVTLREGLRHLEEDGLIVRRHGIGTYVRNVAVKLISPLEQNLGLSEVISRSGFKPGLQGLNIRRGKADKYISQKLILGNRKNVVYVERIRTADEVPLVFTMDAIPEFVLAGQELTDDLGSSIYKFLEDRCGQQIMYGDARIETVKADSNLSKRLSVPINSVMILLEEIDYNQHNQPILFTREFYAKYVVEFTVRRIRSRG
jgi:GntR family transcriptional regulator